MPGDAPLCRDFDLVPCLNSAAQMQAFARDLPGRPCALQLDSGMNRLGLEAAEFAASAHLLPALAPVLAISHLACADAPGHPMNLAQAEAFAALRRPPARRPPQPRRHRRHPPRRRPSTSA